MRTFHTPKNLFLQVSVFLLLVFQFLKPKTKFKFNSLDAAILLRISFYCATLIFINGIGNVFLQVDMSFYLVLYYLLIQMLYDPANRILFMWLFRSASRLLVLAGAVIALYGILQYYNLDIFHPGGYSYYESRVIGTFSNPNPMGGFLSVVIPFCVYLINFSGKKSYKAFFALGLVLMLWSLVLTLSRGAWLALAAGLLVLFQPVLKKIWNALRVRRSYLIGTGIITVMVMSLAMQGLYSINRDSTVGRIFEWRVTWGMITDHPILGVGYGRYRIEYLNYQAHFFDDSSHEPLYDKAANIKRPHNEYFQIAAETGLLGLALFLSIPVIFYRLANRILTWPSITRSKAWAVRVLKSVVTIILVHSLVDNPLHIQPISLIFYFALGIISLDTKHTKIVDTSIISERRRGFPNLIFSNHWILIISAIGLFIINLSQAIKKGRGYVHWQNGQNLVAQGDWNSGIEEYQIAGTALPEEGELKFHLGAAYAYIGQAEQAIPLLNESKSNFNDKNIYIVEGSAFLQLGQYDDAGQCFLTAIRMYPKLLLPRLWLAQMYLSAGRKEEAISRLNEIIAIQPKIMTAEAVSIKADAKRLLRFLEDEG